MTSIIEISQVILILAAGFLISYQLLWSILALSGKKNEHFKTVKNRKFAVILLANNGREIISKSLYSLSGLVYPKNLYDLIVIAEHTTDDFAKIAKNLGALVLEVNSELIKEKQSLEFIFDELNSLDKSYEALIVFDANSFVSGNYLEVMNYYLEHGNEVIQSSSLVLPNPDKTGNKAACVDFLMNNYVKPLGKKTAGIGGVLRNNGTCFAFEMLQELAQNSELSGKDWNLGIVLESKGIRVAFAPEARVFIEDPLNGGLTIHHPNRYARAKKVVGKVRKGLYREQKVQLLDNFLELLTPSMGNIITFAVLMCLINVFLWFYELTSASFMALWGAVVMLSWLHLYIGLRAAGTDRKLYTTLNYWPSHIVAKLSAFLNTTSLPNGAKKIVREEMPESEDLVSGS